MPEVNEEVKVMDDETLVRELEREVHNCMINFNTPSYKLGVLRSEIMRRMEGTQCKREACQTNN